MEGQRLKIKKQIIHPKYINGFKDWNVDYDIAVLITENIGKSIIFDDPSRIVNRFLFRFQKRSFRFQKKTIVFKNDPLVLNFQKTNSDRF